MLKLNFSNLSNSSNINNNNNNNNSNTSDSKSSLSNSNPNEIKFIIQYSHNNTQQTYTFRSDLTVGYVKIHTAEECGIPWNQQEYSLNGVIMADPLSLNDYSVLKPSNMNLGSLPIIICSNLANEDPTEETPSPGAIVNESDPEEGNTSD